MFDFVRLAALLMVVTVVGCDQSGTKTSGDAGQSNASSGGGAQAGHAPDDIGETLPDDYGAQLLLNQAFALADQSKFESATAKVVEVEKLTRVSQGIKDQVAELRTRIATSATRPSTAPSH